MNFYSKKPFDYLLGQIEILYSLTLAKSSNYHLLAIIDISVQFQISIWSILEGQTVSGVPVGIAGFKKVRNRWSSSLDPV